MLRSLFCAALVFTLVLSICLLPQTASARRCPEKEPETLLSLYQNSDAIYIAAFDKLTEGEVIESTDDYSVQEIRKHFTISSTLKGKDRKFFVLEDRKYTYKPSVAEPAAGPVNVPAEAEKETADGEQPAQPEEETEFEEESDGPEELQSGDTLLLFIKEGGDGEEDGPSLTDYSDGIKKMPMEKIGVYEERIKELKAIFSAKQVNAARLLEWVIRCAEDPVTRWEGAYELLKSVSEMEWRQAEEQRRQERIASGLPVEETADEPEEEEDESAVKNFDTSVFAKMLDVTQKQRLANILLNPAATQNTEAREPIPGDRELVELVKRWGDPRLIGFLLDKLRAGADDVYSTSETMRTIADVLGDEEARAIAEKFEENAYEEDDAVVAAADEETEEPEQTKPGPEGETAEPEAQPEADPAAEPEAGPDGKAEEPRKQTYREFRAELVQQFLLQCDKVIAEKERKKTEEQEINSAR